MSESLYIFEKLSKLLENRRLQLIQSITEGHVKDYAEYRFLRGRLEELTWVRESLSDLARKERQQDVEADSP
jgi:hypothetical protein